MKTSPSQVNTRIARISKEAYAQLKELAIKNNTSIAIELDKVVIEQAETLKDLQSSVKLLEDNKQL